jgi:hypothetical protein
MIQRTQCVQGSRAVSRARCGGFQLGVQHKRVHCDDLTTPERHLAGYAQYTYFIVFTVCECWLLSGGLST